VIVEDFFDPLPSSAAALPSSCRPALFTCTEEQAEYVTRAGISRDVIFDGVVRSCITAGYDTIIGVQEAKKKSKEVKGPVERQQLRACRSNYEYMKQYDYQMELLLENIFPKKLGKNKRNPANWMYKMTNVVGGLYYQHPHADQGWGLEYDGEATFPFVATHGFGRHSFEMWLLAKGTRGKNDYGFLHTLKASSLLLMRGDFIHAGGISWRPRCHMKFFPRVGAGLVKGQANQYWLRPQFQCDIDDEKWKNSQEEKTFLWQHFLYPFAYPKVIHTFNKATKELEEIVQYVPAITHGLMSDDKTGRARARRQLRVVVDDDDFELEV
jgi:hypothetical protein